MIDMKVAIPRSRFGEFAMVFADIIDCVFSNEKIMRVTLQVSVSNLAEVQLKLEKFV